MIRICYPNVSNMEFIGCGRLFTINKQQKGYNAYDNIPNALNIENISDKFTRNLDIIKPTIIENKDDRSVRYWGDSINLAYFLILLSKYFEFNDFFSQFDQDFWCTGEISGNSIGIVDQEAFQVKLDAFMSNDNNDKLFIVPRRNIDNAIIGNNNASVLSLYQFRKRLPDDILKNNEKTILKVEDNELDILANTIFKINIIDYWVLFIFFIFGILLSGSIWHILGDMTGTSGIASLYYGIVVTLPMILSALFGINKINFLNFFRDKEVLYISISFITTYSILGGIASYFFYNIGIREIIEGYNMNYILKELIIAFFWSLSFSIITVLPLKDIVYFENVKKLFPIQSWNEKKEYWIISFCQPILTVSLVFLSVNVSCFISKCDGGVSGLLAGFFLRAGLFLSIIIGMCSSYRRSIVQGIPHEEYQLLAKDLGVTENAVKNFFKIIEQKEVPKEDWVFTLIRIATRHKELLLRLDQFNVTVDEEIQELRLKAEEAINEGDYDNADKYLDVALEKQMICIRGLKPIGTESYSNDVKCQDSFKEPGKICQEI